MPRPHSAQGGVISQATRFNVVVCGLKGRRWGKSVLGIDRIVPVAASGYPTAWFAPDYKSILEVWRELLHVLKPITLRTDVQQKRIELVTGGTVEFWSLDSDPEACRGRKYKRIIIDEAAKVKHLETAWTLAIRPTLADYRGDAWLLTTPRGRDYLWQMWCKGQDGREESDPEFKSWQMPTAANPYIDPLEIKAMEREMPRTAFNQEILAQFLDVGGRFFDEWEPERGGEEWHVVTPFTVPRHWLLNAFGGLDYGKSAPFSFHLCVPDGDGDPVIIDEVYEAGILPYEQAQRVKQCLARNGIEDDQAVKRVLIASDPSMFPPDDPEKQIGEYPIEAFWAAGLTCVKAVNDRLATNTRAKEFMHGYRKATDSEGNETLKPTLRVFRGACPNLIRTIPLMVTSEKDVEDFEHDKGEEDHAIDSGLRYAGMTRPQAAKDPHAPKPKLDRWQQLEADYKRSKKKTFI